MKKTNGFLSIVTHQVRTFPGTPCFEQEMHTFTWGSWEKMLPIKKIPPYQKESPYYQFPNKSTRNMETTGIFFYETACTAPPHLTTEARITAAPTATQQPATAMGRRTRRTMGDTTRGPTPARTPMRATADTVRTVPPTGGATATVRPGERFPYHWDFEKVLGKESSPQIASQNHFPQESNPGVKTHVIGTGSQGCPRESLEHTAFGEMSFLGPRRFP